MGIFDFLKKGTANTVAPVNNGPYADPATNHIYELLFCDRPELYKANTTAALTYPYDILFAESLSSNDLQRLVSDDTLDSRLKLLAYHKLAETGHQTSGKILLGVVIEVGLDMGPDTLASFRDGTARYINQSGKMVIWENTNDDQAMALTNELFQKSEDIVRRIGPWDKPRLARPAHGKTRISFLVSDGLYFGEGVTNSFFNDELAAPALTAATKLMQYITQKSLECARAQASS
jgi:hypothetical protein